MSSSRTCSDRRSARERGCWGCCSWSRACLVERGPSMPDRRDRIAVGWGARVRGGGGAHPPPIGSRRGSQRVVRRRWASGQPVVLDPDRPRGLRGCVPRAHGDGRGGHPAAVRHDAAARSSSRCRPGVERSRAFAGSALGAARTRAVREPGTPGSDPGRPARARAPEPAPVATERTEAIPILPAPMPSPAPLSQTVWSGSVTRVPRQTGRTSPR